MTAKIKIPKARMKRNEAGDSERALICTEMQALIDAVVFHKDRQHLAIHA